MIFIILNLEFSDLLIQELQNEHQCDGVYVVGGLGSLVYQENEGLRRFVEGVLGDGGILGAICAAPRNLLSWGLMEGKLVTGHNWDGDFSSLAEQVGAIPRLDQKVVMDGRVMTANGPEASEESALAFHEMLKAI